MKLKKKLHLLFATLFLGFATWLFIWPAFGPYINFVIPIPGTTEIKSIRIQKNLQGKWDADVEYFFTGWPTNSVIKVGPIAGPEYEIDPKLSQFGSQRTAIRGTHTVKFEIPRPEFYEEITTQKVEARLSDWSNGEVVARKIVDFKIDWPDSETYEWERRLNSEPKDALFKTAISLIDRGDARALAEAKAILVRLVYREPNFTAGLEQLVRIADIASWGPNGLSQIDSREKMNEVVNGIATARGYAEMNEIAANLISSQALTADGFTKLRWFHHALNGDYFVLPKIDEKQLKKIEAGRDDIVSKWERRVPGSYLPRIQYAKSLMAVAWQIRGTGYANSVTKSNMDRFHSLAQRATEVLFKCKSICDSDPEWYATIIGTMQLASVDPSVVAPIFVEGFTKFPWYMSIYVAMSSNYTPKWGGSTQAVESFAKELVSHFPVADRDMIYARLYDALYEGGGAFLGYDAQSSNMDCPRAIRGYDTVTKKWPSNHNYNVAARMAKRCSDRSAARRFLAKVGNNADLSVWTATDFSNTVVWAR